MLTKDFCIGRPGVIVEWYLVVYSPLIEIDHVQSGLFGLSCQQTIGVCRSMHVGQLRSDLSYNNVDFFSLLARRNYVLKINYFNRFHNIFRIQQTQNIPKYSIFSCGSCCKPGSTLMFTLLNMSSTLKPGSTFMSTLLSMSSRFKPGSNFMFTLLNVSSSWDDALDWTIKKIYRYLYIGGEKSM